MEPKNKVQHLVVDTSAFIKNAPLQEYGTNIYTAQGVVDEITNKRQLRNLVVLPYNLEVKNVFTENIKYITEFSKKTGDYRSLSSTDIQVMALALQLEKEKVGSDHLREMPEVHRLVSSTPTHTETLNNLIGFYLPSSKEKEGGQLLEGTDKPFVGEQESKIEEKQPVTNSPEVTIKSENEDVIADVPKLKKPSISRQDFLSEEEVEEQITLKKLEEGLQQTQIKDEEGIQQTLDDDDEEEEDDDEVLYSSEEEDDIWNDQNWITPSNVQEAKQQQHGDVDDTLPLVACITSDFAMQNVLRQLGLHVLALDGKEIRNLRTYILRCYCCFKTTSRMELVFCPNCGHKTLKRVGVSLLPDGTQVIHINTKRPLTGRGKRFPLPLPKGGKHANNPVLVADQRIPQQRVSRLARTKNDPLDPDYIAGFSPFIMRDVNSKSAMLGLRNGEVKNWMRANPNVVRKGKKGKKK